MADMRLSDTHLRGKDSWLFFKMKDDEADPSFNYSGGTGFSKIRKISRTNRRGRWMNSIKKGRYTVKLTHLDKIMLAAKITKDDVSPTMIR